MLLTKKLFFMKGAFNLKKVTYFKIVAKNNFIKTESANAVIKMNAVLILCYLAKNNLKSTTIVIPIINLK